MSQRHSARGCLSILLAAAFWPAIFLWLLDPSSRSSPTAPLLRVLLALALAGLSTLMVVPGQPRRQLAGWFFLAVICTSVVRYGDAIGLHAAWQRWLVGLVLAVHLPVRDQHAGRPEDAARYVAEAAERALSVVT